jgi:hypothetical protein
MWSVVAIGACQFSPEQEKLAFAGEKPAKQGQFYKINPACTSHTDRVYGVDVL